MKFHSTSNYTVKRGQQQSTSLKITKLYAIEYFGHNLLILVLSKGLIILELSQR